jgi:hypothetical protein
MLQRLHESANVAYSLVLVVLVLLDRRSQQDNGRVYFTLADRQTLGEFGHRPHCTVPLRTQNKHFIRSAFDWFQTHLDIGPSATT